MRGRTSRRLIGAAFPVAVVMLAACARSPEDRLAEIREMHRTGRIEESIPELIDLIESGSRDGEVFYRYGRALAMTGHPERSIWALDAAMEDPKWLVPAGQQLALDAQRSGNFDFGLEILERLERERPEGEEAEDRERLLHARMLIETNRRYEEALEILDAFLDRSPGEDEALRLKAAALLGLERPDDAYEVIREATRVAEAGGSTPTDVAEVSDGEGGSKEATAIPTDASASDALDAVEDVVAAEDEAPSDREAYWCTIRASFQRESSKLDEAKATIDACLAAHPASVSLINEATKIYSERQPERILEILEAAHAAEPDDPDIRRALVRTDEALGRFDDAEAVLRKRIEAVGAESESPTARLASLQVDLAGFLISRDRIDEALEAFRAADALLGEATPPELQLRFADALIVAGRYDEALAIAERTPVEIHRTMLRGRIAFEQGRYADAIASLDEAALHWPDNAPVHYYLARASEGLGDIDRAVEEYRQAMRSDTNLSAARERLIRLHLAEGKVREASTILNFRSPKKSSAPSMAMRILAVEVRSRMGVEPQLDIPVEAGADVETVRLDTVRALGRGLVLRMGTRSADALLASIEEGSPRDSRGLLVRERVARLLEAGQTEAATEVATRAVAALPNDLHVQLARGRVLALEAETRDEAEAVLRRVAEARPKDAEVWTALGETLAAMGRSDAAVESLDQALRLAPDAWPAMRARVALLLASGRADEARERLTGFVAREAPYSGEALLALAKLQPEDAKSRAKTADLARRAIRFGAGAEAIDVLARVDPEALARLLPASAGAGPGAGPAPPAERARAEDGAADGAKQDAEREEGGSSDGKPSEESAS
ncbi:MAG: tetratricopeptide repeat protein [Myxococcota bacterium]